MKKLKEISKHLTKVTNANEIEEIVKAYVIECSKATLEKASENVYVDVNINGGWHIEIDKDIIKLEENVVLL